MDDFKTWGTAENYTPSGQDSQDSQEIVKDVELELREWRGLDMQMWKPSHGSQSCSSGRE